jgi:hypothetical protein
MYTLSSWDMKSQHQYSDHFLEERQRILLALCLQYKQDQSFTPS